MTRIATTFVYRIDADGGFTCGDRATKLTSYAYPTSANAQQARRAPMAVAREMLAGQTRHGFTHEADYDRRNWLTLSARLAA